MAYACFQAVLPQAGCLAETTLVSLVSSLLPVALLQQRLTQSGHLHNDTVTQMIQNRCYSTHLTATAKKLACITYLPLYTCREEFSADCLHGRLCWTYQCRTVLGELVSKAKIYALHDI